MAGLRRSFLLHKWRIPTSPLEQRPSRNPEFYCRCGGWSEAGPWRFDENCKRCHGSGKYRLHLSRREHHMLLVRAGQHRKFNQRGGIGRAMQRIAKAIADKRRKSGKGEQHG